MKPQLSQSTAIFCFVCIHFILLMEIMLLFGYFVLLKDKLVLSWIITPSTGKNSNSYKKPPP